jgi:hypothetical protein
MVRVSIGGEDRNSRDVTQAWLRTAIEKRRHSGDPVCIQISITSGLIAPPQLNPFAMASRESATHKQTEML